MPRLSKIGAAALAAFGWTGLSSVTASYLVVAGGAGGGTSGGGGGGAGGMQTGTTSLNPTESYTVTVGAGGAAATNGANSQFGSLTASVGGGAGGTSGNGSNGGSGGGGGANGSGTTSGGTATSGQGNAGGTGAGVASNRGAGGGGGANLTTGTGGNGTGSSGGIGGAGGNGLASSISGSSVTYAGGGGGNSQFAAGTASGGTGGGGTGGNTNSLIQATNGTANLGGGGGGGEYNSYGGNGGSGVVIISYVGAQQFGGGVVTSVGGNTIHTFTTSGTLSPLNSLTANFLVVAGGGGGGGGNGGGGAGGLLSGSGLTLDTNSIYAVTVGAGGTAAGASAGGNGGNSSFSMVSTTAVGGGGGGYQGGTTTGASGGSGGGGSYVGSAAGGTGTAGQGNNGGSGIFAAVQYGGGGGGGANAVGANGTSTAGGNGGSGLQNPITGSTTGELSGGIYYLAGGGGGGANTASAGTGGLGGGGAGGINSGVGTAGTPNTGGGGGGGATTGAATFSGGAGGSGVVIISYPGSTQQMAGGTVTVAGGNVIHTFTSSGYLTPIVLANNSLRFRSSASAYLNRNAVTPTLGTKCTFSCWHKRGQLGSFAPIFSADKGSSYDEFGFESDDTFYIYTTNGTVGAVTSAVFRDPSAWYHIVCAIDTTQTTASDRIKIYINGVQQTLSGTYPAPNYVISWQVNAVTQFIAKRATASTYRDGYLAEVNFIDGQALTPNSFGTSNGLGVWQPIRYGGSYGTNGFYLPFTASTSSTYAGSFNASNQSLSTPNASQFSLGSSDFTVEAWVYLTNSSTSTSNNVLNQSDGGAGSNSAFFFGVGSNGVALYLSTTGTSWTNFINGGSVIPQQNRWYHIVWQRSGNTIQTFVNGVLSNSDTFSGTVNTSTRNIEIGCQNNAGSFFGGYISNVRLVKGVAVYTNGFTPPTANLSATQSAGVNISAITGTQTSYLTLQNSSIVDNSTFAVTITNNNGVATSVQYPFVTQAFNDKGPAGNNWTPNNIGGLFGSSYDFMTDVPTLTSATTANYCVMNPLRVQNVSISAGTLSDGNLKITTSASDDAYSNHYGTMAFPRTGKWYFETVFAGAFGNDAGNYAGIIGVSDGNAGCTVVITSTTVIQKNFSNVQTGLSFSAGDILGIAFDATNLTVDFYKNGSAFGSQVTGLNSVEYTPFILASNPANTQSSWTLNFGQRPFAYTPPTGFVALNTFNLTTPTIGATASTTANKYFDIALRTSAGTAGSSVTSLNFQPDFVWDKTRSISGGHYLEDAVRGVGKYLLSQSTAAEQTDNNYISSFTSNGFTMGNNDWAAGTTLVDWCWKANGAGSTNTAGSIISTVSANTTAGFSIVTYTGNNTGGATVGHGLGVTPSMIFVKVRNATARWVVYQKDVITANNQFLELDLPAGVDTSGTNFWTISSINDTTFGLGANGDTNGSTLTFVAYCFAPVAGYSAFGTYTGNGATDGPFIYTGFRPRFVMIKRTSSGTTGNWSITDTAINPYNNTTGALRPNTADSESTVGTVYVQPLSNGFKITNNNTDTNGSSTYIYMAFAESPFKYANAR